MPRSLCPWRIWLKRMLRSIGVMNVKDHGCVERENGHRTNPSLPRLEEGISCAHGNLIHFTEIRANIGGRGGIGTSYSIHKKEFVQGYE